MYDTLELEQKLVIARAWDEAEEKGFSATYITELTVINKLPWDVRKYRTIQRVKHTIIDAATRGINQVVISFENNQDCIDKVIDYFVLKGFRVDQIDHDVCGYSLRISWDS
jgi:hypothetical protein